MPFFYGWVIVVVGIVVTCVGFGAMMSLTVFLQPMSDAMGWSRTGISTAALLNFLSMGAGLAGVPLDRFGTGRRPVGGALLASAGDGEPGGDARLVQILFGVIVGLARQPYAPMTADHQVVHAQSHAGGRPGLGRLSFGSTFMAAGAVLISTTTGARHARLGDLVAEVIPAPCGAQPPGRVGGRVVAAAPRGPVSRWGRRCARRSSRHRAHALRLLCGALGPISTWRQRHRPRGIGDGRARAQRGRRGLVQRQDRLWAGGRPRRRQAHARDRARDPGVALSLTVQRSDGGFYAVAALFALPTAGHADLRVVVVSIRRQHHGPPSGRSRPWTPGQALGPGAGEALRWLRATRLFIARRHWPRRRGHRSRSAAAQRHVPLATPSLAAEPDGTTCLDLAQPSLENGLGVVGDQLERARVAAAASAGLGAGAADRRDRRAAGDSGRDRRWRRAVHKCSAAADATSRPPPPIESDDRSGCRPRGSRRAEDLGPVGVLGAGGLAVQGGVAA